MDNLKTFLADKVTLLMTLVSFLMVAFNILSVLLQLNTAKTVAIVRYNSISLPEFVRGDTRSLYVFLLAPLVFLATHLVIAVKMHEKNRGLSIIVMGMSYIILLFGIIVSGAVIGANR